MERHRTRSKLLSSCPGCRGWLRRGSPGHRTPHITPYTLNSNTRNLHIPEEPGDQLYRILHVTYLMCKSSVPRPSVNHVNRHNCRAYPNPSMGVPTHACCAWRRRARLSPRPHARHGSATAICPFEPRCPRLRACFSAHLPTHLQPPHAPEPEAAWIKTLLPFD